MLAGCTSPATPAVQETQPPAAEEAEPPAAEETEPPAAEEPTAPSAGAEPVTINTGATVGSLRHRGRQALVDKFNQEYEENQGRIRPGNWRSRAIHANGIAAGGGCLYVNGGRRRVGLVSERAITTCVHTLP
jgi:hypothetical protein